MGVSNSTNMPDKTVSYHIRTTVNDLKTIKEIRISAEAAVKCAKTEEARVEAMENLVWVKGVEKSTEDNLKAFSEIKKKNE